MGSEKILLKDYADFIKIVLVGTTHPGNIGSAARAIKTMGLRQLDLVSPKEFPSDQAIYRSKAAKDILEEASIYDSLLESVKDCEMVIGTSARNRKVPWPVLDPKHAAKEIKSKVENNSKVAIVFGREDRGLTNEEMEVYRRPFLIPEDRRPTLDWPNQIPIDGHPEDVVNIVTDYSKFMKDSDIPKLFINAEPGSILVGKQREFCRAWKNQKEVTVSGSHFIQEDSPHEIGQVISEWVKTI
mgnify:CR=1 FL=1